MANCLHCELEVPAGGPAAPGFCCLGCEAAHGMVTGMGLERYYRRRRLDPRMRAPRPDDRRPPVDYDAHASMEADGTRVLNLMVEGLHCAACVWLIESVLSRQPDTVSARVNLTTRRLVLKWRGEGSPDAIVAPVGRLGYRLVPFDPVLLGRESARQEAELLRAMAVAGFAAANVMLLSVSLWAGQSQGMGPAMRDFLHWLSALVALPAIAYAGRPFFRSALGALWAARTNMDVPISLAMVLTAAMSLFETFAGGDHVYFDSAITLLFFLLVGRYLDRRARGRARGGAEHLLALAATAVTVIEPGGARRLAAPSKVAPGTRVLAAAGERIGIDGCVVEGNSEVDTGLVNGETVPGTVAPGDHVFSGTVNLSAPLTIEVTAVGEDTLLAGIVRLMEAAELERGRYVALADRVARLYAPTVHGLALAAFVGWLAAGTSVHDALLVAVAVLIVTCPCALGLAVPAVQVIASGRLLERGILVKSGTALERFAAVDTVVFDKTGTLTEGRPQLIDAPSYDPGALDEAASLAAASRHPLARALARAAPLAAVAPGVVEVPGQGLSVAGPGGETRLGSRRWCGLEDDGPTSGPELWLARAGMEPLRFAFTDRPRDDAARVVAALRERGMDVALLSGDRKATVAAVAAAVGIDDWRAGLTAAGKCARLAELEASGRRVLMVGDGLNDAPALAAAHVSMSPSSAIDISQTAADAVFQGALLAPLTETLEVARRAGWLIKQNLGLALAYNILAVPLAVAGLVNPLVAAVAMSASSLAVIANAMRLARGRVV